MATASLELGLHPQSQIPGLRPVQMRSVYSIHGWCRRENISFLYANSWFIRVHSEIFFSYKSWNCSGPFLIFLHIDNMILSIVNYIYWQYKIYQGHKIKKMCSSRGECVFSMTFLLHRCCLQKLIDVGDRFSCLLMMSPTNFSDWPVAEDCYSCEEKGSMVVNVNLAELYSTFHATCFSTMTLMIYPVFFIYFCIWKP